MKDPINTHRVVTFLNRDELEFLDKLEKDMMFSTGTHISRSKIIEDMINLFLATRMNANGIKSDEELKQKLAEALIKKTQ